MGSCLQEHAGIIIIIIIIINEKINVAFGISVSSV